MQQSGLVLGQVLSIAAALWAGVAFAGQPIPSEIAEGGIGNYGFSFRVLFWTSDVGFNRTSYELPRRGTRVMPAYVGASHPIFRIALGRLETNRVEGHRGAWDHQVARYKGAVEGTARAVSSRLSPAVLIDCPWPEITVRGGIDGGAAPALVAFVRGGKVVVHRVAELAKLGAADLDLDEPWLLGWFGQATPHRGYLRVMDLDPEHDGAGFARVPHPADKLDLPILFRLEHKPLAIEQVGGGLVLRFHGAAGKITVMPLFGGRLFQPRDTETWSRRLPQEVTAQCRLWSRILRDYPLAVSETFAVDTEQDVLSVRQAFRWVSFDDDWNSPPVKAAPLPPMLALALGGDVPVTFHQGGRRVEPVDYRLMDTPGKAMGIEGQDRYEYRIAGLAKYLFPRPAAATASGETAALRTKLERHVAEMVDTGHLAPLFYIYGGIGGPRPGYFYWAGSPELARTLEMAYPYLSTDLQKRVVTYLKKEWILNPPFQVNLDKYREGTNRAPYDVPWEDIGRDLASAHNRERKLRQAHLFGDLYGVDAYYRLTGQRPHPELKDRIAPMARQLLAQQDWALSAPVRPHTNRIEFLTGGAYYERNGQAAANGWLAGAAGMVRLARRLEWPEGEQLGWYLFGKLAMARVGQARYTAEMHRMGLVGGDQKDDWRTLVHIDRTAAIVLRGNVKPMVVEDQELPPFVDLVEPVGRLLGAHAREQCRIYLDHLDRSMPLWYISEAPKQSASEQRLCPLQYKNGNVLAQSWILGKQGRRFLRYVDTTRLKGDLYYIQNLAAAIAGLAQP